MKLSQIIFILFAFAILKAMILETSQPSSITFPTFTAPSFTFSDPGDCSSFLDCTEFLAKVVLNIGLGFVYLVVLVGTMIGYVASIFALLVAVNFTGIDGAPGWINFLLSLPFLSGLGIILYKLFRKGSSED